jgi:class 3 adenylate cyclase/tetratricopeptide (TPR) repeat protein
LVEKILTSRSALESERKQVTVLFCDLANSTAMATHLGPDHMHTLLNRFFELALDAVHRLEGIINQFLGDGFMALFGAPIAHEDHPRRAVLAALALQQTLHDQHAVLGEPYGVRCQFRMGLNSGLVVVGSIGDNLRMDYSAIGDTTNLAARLQQLAEPGTVLLSESTQRLVQGTVRLEALPPVQVKGKPEPLTPYKVLGTLPRRSPVICQGERTLSQFVGRSRELAVLEELLEQVESGQGQVIGLVAEAGAGKSRLLYEFRQRLHIRRVTYLEGRCLSYGSNIPYHLIIDIVRHNCGITDPDSPAVITEKVRGALQEVGMDAEDAAPYLLQLLGVKDGTERLSLLTPEAIKIHTFDTLNQMSLQGSQQRPLLFEVEDLQWIDRMSEAYLAALVESMAGAPILLLTTYRPGYRPPWLDKSYAAQLALRSLAPHDAFTVVRSTSQRAALPEHRARLIVEKAEGNPFFLEELTRAVLGHAEFQTALTVPDTIQGVLMARMDRLPEVSKRLLQTASVLGREFSPRLLEAIWDGPRPLGPLLQELKQLEFLYERSGSEGLLYVFKHALTQEVAYETLLTTRRRALHAVAGRALEALYVDRLEEVYDRLAYHYARTDEADKAVAYLTSFAEKAARSYAHAEAVSALQEALSCVERLSGGPLDRLVLELTLRQAHSLYFLGRFPESLELLLREQERLTQLQDPTLAGPYYFWLGHTYSYLGDQELATQSAQRAIAVARQCGDEVTMGKAYYVLARSGFWSGQFLQGVEYGRQAVALLERTAERWWMGQAHWAVGANYGFVGDFAPAVEAARRAHAVGEALGDLRLQTYAAWTIGWIEVMRGDWEAALQACQRGLERSPDPLSTAMALAFLGYAYLEHGDASQAILLLEQAVQQFSQFRFRLPQGWFTLYLSEAALVSSDLGKARALALQGLEIAREVKFAYGVGLGQRVLGRIAQASGALAEAATYLTEALQSFASIQARFDMGRIHLDLAALTHDAQGHPEVAATHLTEAHALFTALQVPRYVERTMQLASAFGLALSAGGDG